MMKRVEFTVLPVLCALACLLPSTRLQAQSSAQDKLNALFGDEIIARGDGFTISRAALDESVVTIRASTAGRRGVDLSRPAMERLEREVTRRLINIELLKQLATPEDLAEAAKRAGDRIETLAERAGSEETMARQLKAVGLSVERLREKLVEEATAEVVLERELKIQITDEQVQQYYDENPERFQRPERVRAAHILLRTRNPMSGREYADELKQAKYRKAEELLERARSGVDFAKLVEQNSEDERSKAQDGEYEFSRGQMPPAFEAAAFTLSEGKVSDIVTTPLGYHIIKVYERIPASTVELDDAVKEEIRNYLKGQAVITQMQPFVADLMEKAHVEILVDSLKPQEGDDPLRRVGEPEAAP